MGVDLTPETSSKKIRQWTQSDENVQRHNVGQETLIHKCIHAGPISDGEGIFGQYMGSVSTQHREEFE